MTTPVTSEKVVSLLAAYLDAQNQLLDQRQEQRRYPRQWERCQKPKKKLRKVRALAKRLTEIYLSSDLSPRIERSIAMNVVSPRIRKELGYIVHVDYPAFKTLKAKLTAIAQDGGGSFTSRERKALLAIYDGAVQINNAQELEISHLGRAFLKIQKGKPGAPHPK